MDKFRFFDLNMGNLPDKLPIFVLPDVVLLPEGRLSVRVTDIAQINEIFWSLSNGRMLALLPQKKTTPLQLGCAARICGFSENEDDSLNVSLVGVCRFQVLEQFVQSSFDTVKVNFLPFLSDFETVTLENDELLLESLHKYLKNRHIDVDVSLFSKMSPRRWLATLVSVLPLEFIEKQALLEHADFHESINILTTILNLSSQNTDLNRGAQKC